MQNYSEVLVDSIEREKKGIDYICPKADKELLRELLDEINSHAGTDYHYLAELDAFNTDKKRIHCRLRRVHYSANYIYV